MKPMLGSYSITKTSQEEEKADYKRTDAGSAERNLAGSESGKQSNDSRRESGV